MISEKEPFLYERVRTINCVFSSGVIVGEDTYARDCTFGKNVHINRRNFLQNVEFGDYSYTGHNTTIKHTKIGKFCSISWNVSIGGADHDYSKLSTHPFPILSDFGFSNIGGGYSSYEEPLVIGNDVWIGSGVEIPRGVTIADGAVIGAGSVVTKDIPPYAVAVGNPARVLRKRFSDTVITRLMNLKWWDLDEGIIKDNINLFTLDVSERTLSILESIKSSG